MPRARNHLLGRCDSFFHGLEGTTQTPIAVVYHAVEIELVLDDVNMPDAPLLPVEDNQNSLWADGRVSITFHLNPQDVAARSRSLVPKRFNNPLLRGNKGRQVAAHFTTTRRLVGE